MLPSQPDKKRTNRKRKAQEAGICESYNGDVKRLKLVSPIRNNHQIHNNSNNSCDPFASFAGQSNGFSSLIHTSSQSQTPNIQKKNQHQKPEKKPEQKQEESKVDNKPKETYAFGSFSDFNDTAVVFSDWSNNKNSKKQNNDVNAWGNSIANGNEFEFDQSASQFSMADINNDHGEESENVFAATEEKPVLHVSLGGKVDSGDSDDKTVFIIKCIVYELDVERNLYKEKGIGDVKLNTYSLNNKNGNETERVHARLLCRKDVTFKTLMNAVLMKETKFDKANEKSIRFTVFEQQPQQQIASKTKDKDGIVGIINVPKSYLLKSKESDKLKIDAFLTKIKEIQQKM